MLSPRLDAQTRGGFADDLQAAAIARESILPVWSSLRERPAAMAIASAVASRM
jgi:hypothetical protein